MFETWTHIPLRLVLAATATLFALRTTAQDPKTTAQAPETTQTHLGPHTLHRAELPNGLRLLALQGTNDTADVYLAIGTGKRHESHLNAGIAHLTEHAMFTGTPTTGPQLFEQTVVDWGGKANAYTRDDYTLYYDTGIPTNRLPTLLAMEADRLRNLSFDPEAFAFEQEQLRREEAGTFTFQQELDALIDALAYPDHPYGSGLLTNRHTRAPSLPLEAVKQFYQTRYRPQHTAVVLVTPSPGQAIAHARAAFATPPAPESRPVPATRAPAAPALPRLQTQAEHTLERPLTEAIHLAVHRLPPLTDTPELAPQLDLLALLLERHAATLTPPLRTTLHSRVEGGLLILKSSAPLATDTLDALAALPIPSNELATAQSLLRDTIANLPLHTRPYFSLGAELAAAEVTGLGSIPPRYAELIDATTAAELHALARRVLAPDRRTRIHLLPDGSRKAEALPQKPADLADYADRAQAEGRFDDAIRAYTKLFERTQSHMYKVIYLTTRAQLHIENKNYPAGIADFKQALALSDYPAIKPLLADAEDRLAKQMGRGQGAPPPAGRPATPKKATNAAKPADPENPANPDSPTDPTAERGEADPERDATVAKELAEQRAELERLIPEISAEIETWRGLKFKQPVTVTFTNVTASENLAGYYNSETKALVVKVHRGRPRFSRGVLLHELVHALQDQHYDLLARHTEATRHGIDAERALSCLIEGVAILAVADLMKYDFAAHSDISTAKDDIDDARFDKLFTYGQGYSFVKQLMKDGEWGAIAKAWENPPRRTIEILDVDRYRETPQGDGSAGAYDLVRHLVEKPETRPKALASARLLESAARQNDTLAFTFESPQEATAVAKQLGIKAKENTLRLKTGE